MPDNNSDDQNSSSTNGSGGGEKQLIYFADPMCSWCWGYSPVITAVQERFGDRVPLRLVMGGLRAGNTKVMDAAAKAEIKNHWEHVGSMTGQPFDFKFFRREDFVYDTEPACRAVVTMRRLAPEEALPFLARLHQAFYSENRDVTDADVLAELGGATGIDREKFKAELEAEDARLETRIDFTVTLKTGVRSFPTLIAGNDEDGFHVVNIGYKSFEDVAEPLDQWMEK